VLGRPCVILSCPVCNESLGNVTSSPFRGAHHLAEDREPAVHVRGSNENRSAQLSGAKTTKIILLPDLKPIIGDWKSPTPQSHTG
jgi:hypothetical protein